MARASELPAAKKERAWNRFLLFSNLSIGLLGPCRRSWEWQGGARIHLHSAAQGGCWSRHSLAVTACCLRRCLLTDAYKRADRNRSCRYSPVTNNTVVF